MIAVPVQRPVRLSVESIVEGKIGVQPCANRPNIVLRKVEGVFIVVEVANLQIPIDRIERLGAQGDVLDLRPTYPFQPDLPFSRRQRFADHSEHRPTFEKRRPLDLENNCQDILAVEQVGANFFERELSCLHGLSGHRSVKEERIGPLPCEDVDAFAAATLLVVHAEWNDLAAWCSTTAPL